MKKLLLLSTMVIGISVTSIAQEVTKESVSKNPKEPRGGKDIKEMKGQHQAKMTPEERAQKSVDHLNKAVGLTDDQKTKIHDLALTRATKVDGVREKYKGQQGSKETAKNEIIAIKKEYRQGVKAVLTPEQMQKLKSRAADAGTGQGQMHDKGGKGMKGGKDQKADKDLKGGKEVDDDKLIGDED